MRSNVPDGSSAIPVEMVESFQYLRNISSNNIFYTHVCDTLSKMKKIIFTHCNSRLQFTVR